jgi:hypothetical protein
MSQFILQPLKFLLLQLQILCKEYDHVKLFFALWMEGKEFKRKDTNS